MTYALKRVTVLLSLELIFCLDALVFSSSFANLIDLGSENIIINNSNVVNTNVYFYGCENNVNKGSVQFNHNKDKSFLHHFENRDHTFIYMLSIFLSSKHMNETFITCHYSGPDNKKAFSNKIIYTKGKGEDISTIFNISKDEKLPVCKNGKNHIYVSNDNKEYSIRYNLTKLDGTFIGTTLYIFSYNEELKEPILFPCRILRLTKVEKKDSGGTKSIINGLTIGLIVCLTIACILIIVLAVLLNSSILRKRRKTLVKFHRKSYCNSNLDMSCSLASSRSKDNTSKFSKSKDSSSNFSKSEEKSLGTKKNNEVLSRNTKNEMNSLKLFSKNNLKSQNTEKKIKDKAMSLSLKTRQRSAEYT